jgi:hypothetical protein
MKVRGSDILAWVWGQRKKSQVLGTFGLLDFTIHCFLSLFVSLEVSDAYVNVLCIIMFYFMLQTFFKNNNLKLMQKNTIIDKTLTYAFLKRKCVEEF